MLDRDTLCTLRIPTYTRCKYTRECIIYLYTAPAHSACNWSKARLVPPLGWTNGYAQAKANPCASSTSSFSFSTTSSSSNDLHLLLRSKIFASDVTQWWNCKFFSFFFFFRICIGPLGKECGPACAHFSTGRKILIERMAAVMLSRTAILNHSHRGEESKSFLRFYAHPMSIAHGRRSCKHGEHGIFNNGQR